MSSRRIGGGALLAVFGAMPGLAAELPVEGAQRHLGVATCAASQCHGSAIPRDATGVLQNEYVTWTQSDPHSRAYTVLLEAPSQRIAARLGIGPAHEADICLDCHADNVPVEKRGPKFQVSDGVGCEACHGGAENWLTTHYNAASDAGAGLYPASRPGARAELCLSCHLGTRNRFATHRIMAAGHPRLAFELDTFTELWRAAGRQPHYRVDADYAERKGAPDHVHTWVIGLLADARRRLDLVSSARFAGDGLFPELGLYDCHACHRTMKTVRWQPLDRRGRAGPGLPFISDGTFVMALALAKGLDAPGHDDLSSGLERLHRAGSESVAEVRQAAATLDSALARLAGVATPGRLAGRERAILTALLEAGAGGNYIDYASAEQAFMAVQILAFELDDPELLEELDTLAAVLDDDERFRPSEFERLLSSLR